MNGYEAIAEKLRGTGVFKNVYTVESLSCSRYKTVYKSKTARRVYKLLPDLELKNYIKIKYVYDELFMANVDGFSVLLFAALYKKNKVKLNIFEDGVATYSKLFEAYYHSQHPPINKIKYFLFCKIFKIKYIYPNANCFYVFNGDAMLWDPGCKIENLQPISRENDFVSIVNKIFDYDNMTDLYDKKYIYFEESFYADSGYMEDVELVEKIAKLVGKENVMVKIHPRNPENRFERLGYKTNKNTSIPWEVILMNNDFSDTVLITIASSTILNSMALFSRKIESYSLIDCLQETPKILKGDFANCILNFYREYPESIHICAEINDIVKEI